MNDFEAAAGKRLLSICFANGRTAGPPERNLNFIAAVSGGADSTAMLAALTAIRDKAVFEPAGGDKSVPKPFTLKCLHVEHGIRPPAESRGDAGAVKSLCQKLNVPCKIVHIPQGLIEISASKLNIGIEAAARFYRHRIWNRESRRFGGAGILVAHTKDDLLETILMRILRGAGPAGLASLPGQRGVILRPLLDLSRREVLSYLEERGLSYRVDSTNEDTRYLRNRIRGRLIPCLDGNFPFWRSALERLGETQRLAAAFISSEAEKRLVWEEAGGGLRIPLKLFLGEKPALREEAFFQAVDLLAAKKRKSQNPFKVPRRASLRRFLTSLEAGESNSVNISACDLGPVRAERRAEYLLLKRAEKPKRAGGFSLLIKEKGSYTLKNRFIVEVEEPGAPLQAEGDFSFRAVLPLVFRGEESFLAAGQRYRFSGMIKNPKEYCGEIVAAEDKEGIAALFGISGGKPVPLYRREGEIGNFNFSVKRLVGTRTFGSRGPTAVPPV